jgi:iron complex transport system substrate-binding protein
MSISLCTDAQLIDLVQADRITSVTYLSRQPGYSSLLPLAARLCINHGLAEEVLADKPVGREWGKRVGGATQSAEFP